MSFSLESIQKISDQVKKEAEINGVTTNSPKESVVQQSDVEGNVVKSTPHTNAKSIEEMDDESLNKLLEKRGLKVVKEEKQETPEQKQKRLQEEKADMIKFAVEQLNMKVEDLTESDIINSKEDMDLVYEEFSKKQKAKSKNINEETIRRRFNNEYYQDEFADEEDRDWGSIKIKESADQIRKSAMSPFEKVKEEYTSYKEAERVHSAAKKEAKEYIKNMNKVFEIKVQDEVVPIEIPEVYLQGDFVKRFTDSYMYAKSHNPHGSVDAEVIAKSILRSDLIEHAASVAASIKSNKAVEDALRPYKNPLTQTRSAEAPRGTDESKMKQSIDSFKQSMPRF
jgi:hypothetical protein